MSLLEAPCAKTSWRALLFRAILGIMGALIVCFDIWRFKQVNNSETGFGGHHCDFGQHVPCLTVHVHMNSVKFVLEAPSASIFGGSYSELLFSDNVQTHLGGTSVREGTSNRDITVWQYFRVKHTCNPWYTFKLFPFVWQSVEAVSLVLTILSPSLPMWHQVAQITPSGLIGIPDQAPASQIDIKSTSGWHSLLFPGLLSVVRLELAVG